MKRISVGVTGINAFDNPGPGIGVIKGLKSCDQIEIKAVGLFYDAMEPGIYMRWLVDEAYVLPYPSEGEEALYERLIYIKQKSGLDVVIPNLDAELPLFIKISDKLRKAGIMSYLPSWSQFKLRSKDKLSDLADKIGLAFPKTFIVTSYEELFKAANSIGYPVMVKGLFYKAYKAFSYSEAVGHFNALVKEWGYPVVVQEVVSGDELNVVGVGDGRGGLLGIFSIKKMWITELGKIWTGVSIKNGLLEEAAEKFVKETGWRGPFELECIRASDKLYLIEINPRFPAWVYFACACGINLPLYILMAALGRQVDQNPDYDAGKLYIRYTDDFVTDMSVFEKVVIRGEL